MHPSVWLSSQIAKEDAGLATGKPLLETETFRAAKKTVAELDTEAMALREMFKKGGALLGGFMALIITLKLISYSTVPGKRSSTHTPAKETCFSCGRCYPYCPVEAEPKRI